MAENTKKQIPLRLSAKLYNEIAAWAEDDFRSVNGQIEYLLSECVRSGKRTANMSPKNWISRLILTLDKKQRKTVKGFPLFFYGLHLVIPKPSVQEGEEKGHRDQQ